MVFGSQSSLWHSEPCSKSCDPKLWFYAAWPSLSWLGLFQALLCQCEHRWEETSGFRDMPEVSLGTALQKKATGNKKKAMALRQFEMGFLRLSGEIH